MERPDTMLCLVQCHRRDMRTSGVPNASQTLDLHGSHAWKWATPFLLHYEEVRSTLVLKPPYPWCLKENTDLLKPTKPRLVQKEVSHESESRNGPRHAALHSIPLRHRRQEIHTWIHHVWIIVMCQQPLLLSGMPARGRQLGQGNRQRRVKSPPHVLARRRFQNTVWL